MSRALAAVRDPLGPLRHFVFEMTDLVDRGADERAVLTRGAALLAELIAEPDWLPASHAAAAADGYRQYLLYCDPAARFSVVSFVWGPGQGTPIHDHRVWGLIGILRGAELSERFARRDGRLEPQGRERLDEGAIDLLSPAAGDLHRVSNAAPGVSISIHVYGGNIGAVERATYHPGGAVRAFVSGYSDAPPLAL